ncbi:MAG: DUF4097 domain-containing protein [Spirochaetaceae bacterium]|jgi:DUF4097 and DUF4098 domain-containing protein YvlB|nr:DUF4097 domain-containing protein [Spirochaetaceae bacterium]
MKTNFFVMFFLISNIIAGYCGGLNESDMVNLQEIELEDIDSIEVAYSWENIKLFESNDDKLIIKEYMSKDDSKYYARISHSGNKILVEKGRRPFGIGTGILFNVFNARVEVYIPASYTRKIAIETTSGKIESEGEFFVSEVNIKSSSGNIFANTITADAVNLRASSGDIRGGTINGNTNIHTGSGNIIFDNLSGDVSAKASSGRIVLKCVTGNVTAETTSGNIRCAVTETAGDIALTASSGGITLELPRNHHFNFSARTSAGHISTPFSDKLFSPLSDRHLVQGVIGNETASNNNPDINIRTKAGSIKIDWVN